VLDEAHGQPLSLEERATEPLVGGLKMHGYQCGALWGAALAAGAEAHRVLGPGPKAELAALAASQQLVGILRDRHGSIDCDDINGTEAQDLTPASTFVHFFLKGGALRCVHLCSTFAPRAQVAIQAAIAEPSDPPACSPVSCAAELARRAGASDLHATMAAGLAGGVGLCGDACGALGAATWLLGLRLLRDEGVDKLWDGERFEAQFAHMLERYLEVSDYAFECAEVVGRPFEGIDDHAAWLQDGGCAAILDALAEAVNAGPVEVGP